jgi:hypothetical protein
MSAMLWICGDEKGIGKNNSQSKYDEFIFE